MKSVITTNYRQALEVVFLLAAAALPAFASWKTPAPPVNSFSISLSKALAQDTLWVDARPPETRSQGMIPQAIGLSMQKWEEELAGFFEQYQPGQAVVIYCDAGCHSAETVAGRVRELGLEPVYVLEGGYQAWRHHQKKLN